MSAPCVLLVDADILVRGPLADYLRACGFRVLEAASAEEARAVFAGVPGLVDIVLADAGEGQAAFELARWLRGHAPATRVVLAGTVATAARKAGDLCEEGPAPTRPYDHHQVLDHIRRLLAARENAR